VERITRCVSANDERLDLVYLVLEPNPASLPRLIHRVFPFGDNPLERQLFCRRDDILRRAVDAFRQSYRVSNILQPKGQQLTPFLECEPHEVFISLSQKVERIEMNLLGHKAKVLQEIE